MATATVNGVKHRVRVTQDLGQSFSLELFPEPAPGATKESEPYKTWPVPMILKLVADTPADALIFGLEHLRAIGRIEAFELEELERPKPPG